MDWIINLYEYCVITQKLKKRGVFPAGYIKSGKLPSAEKRPASGIKKKKVLKAKVITASEFEACNLEGAESPLNKLTITKTDSQKL